MNKAYKKYMRQVRSLLPCSRNMKNEIMDKIRENMADWMEEHPDAQYEQLVAHFGSPEKFAAEYIEYVGTEKVLHNLHIKQKVMRIIMIAAIAVILIWGIGVTVAVIDAIISNHYGYITTGWG